MCQGQEKRRLRITSSALRMPTVVGKTISKTYISTPRTCEYATSVVGSPLQMETQREVKGKNDKELYELEL